MKNKKIVVLSSMFLVVLAIAVYALTLSNPTPSSGSTIVGTNYISQNFSIEGDSNMSSGWVLIHNGSQYISYGLDCSANTTCSNHSVNLTTWDDLAWYDFYFFIDGTPSTTYNFSINRPPTQVLALSVSGHNITALQLNWTNNAESDLAGYRIYRDNTTNVVANSTYLVANESTVTVNNYLDTNLVTGSTYYYLVSAADSIGQEGPESTMQSGTVADATPPIEPVVNPASGSTVNTTNPSININYTAGAENVTLNIYSGSQLVKTYPMSAMNFLWEPVLLNGTMYFFTFNASDQFNNVRLTNYTITTTNEAGLNFSVVDTIHLTSTATGIINSVLPGDYILIKESLDMFTMTQEAFVRVRMDDLTSVSGNIDVNQDTQPLLFCWDDYNSTSRDIVGSPTKTTYNILNQYNESASPLNCTDQDAGTGISYDVFIKIPIPSSANAAVYTSNIYLGMYDHEG